MKKEIGLVKLDISYFDNNKQYENYLKTYKANNYVGEDDYMGGGYITAIWNLINLFIKERDCSDDIVKKSPDYEMFSGFQVNYAQSYYKKLFLEEINE